MLACAWVCGYHLITQSQLYEACWAKNEGTGARRAVCACLLVCVYVCFHFYYISYLRQDLVSATADKEETQETYICPPSLTLLVEASLSQVAVTSGTITTKHPLQATCKARKLE